MVRTIVIGSFANSWDGTGTGIDVVELFRDILVKIEHKSTKNGVQYISPSNQKNIGRWGKNFLVHYLSIFSCYTLN